MRQGGGRKDDERSIAISVPNPDPVTTARSEKWRVKNGIAKAGKYTKCVYQQFVDTSYSTLRKRVFFNENGWIAAREDFVPPSKTHGNISGNHVHYYMPDGRKLVMEIAEDRRKPWPETRIATVSAKEYTKSIDRSLKRDDESGGGKRRGKSGRSKNRR